MVTFLVTECGADINARDGKEGMTPLHFAALCEHQSIVDFLRQAGADASICDDSGVTALELLS